MSKAGAPTRKHPCVQILHAPLAAMAASHDEAPKTAADKALHLAIADATLDPGAAGHSWRDRHAPAGGIRVAGNSVDGWFEDNLAHHAATTHAIEEGDAKTPATPWCRFLGFNRPNLPRRQAGTGRRNGRPGGSRSLRKK